MLYLYNSISLNFIQNSRFAAVSEILRNIRHPHDEDGQPDNINGFDPSKEEAGHEHCEGDAQNGPDDKIYSHSGYKNLLPVYRMMHISFKTYCSTQFHSLYY